MILPPGPYRLYLNGELIARCNGLPAITGTITRKRKETPNPGEFKAYDARGGLIMSHTGERFIFHERKSKDCQRTANPGRALLVKAVPA